MRRTGTETEGTLRTSQRDREIAVVGLSCRFPGAADRHAFWSNLVRGVNSVREIPPERWSAAEYHSADRNAPNRSVSKWCGVLDQADQFDNRFFNISPREAGNMDPQQRLLLEDAWHAVEDSGIPLPVLQQASTGVFVGIMTVDYRQHVTAPAVQTDSYACLGNFECMVANRISYALDLKGPSMPVNAGSASALVALHAAKQALLAGECEYALVGAVNLNLHPWKYISFSKSRMLSPDGQCKTFDARANGYVPGDGVGVLLLQRSAEARRTRNRVYGVVLGSAINHVGKAASITAPRLDAQRDVLLAAYKDAGISPATISYIEAHGTGTPLGDPIEVEALTQAFRAYTADRQFCRIGSVKPNIGHLESAAGMAGICKIFLMMQHRQIVPTIHQQSINPVLNFPPTPFMVASELMDWQAPPGLPRRAGVSSIGFGGVNAHVVLEEPDGARRRAPEPGACVFGLSARTPESLARTLEGWRALAASPAFREQPLAEICMTAVTGRESFAYRCGAVVRDHADLVRFLDEAQPQASAARPCSLRICDMGWQGRAPLMELRRSLPGIRRQLRLAVRKASVVVGAERLRGLKKPQWQEADRPLFSFMLGWACVSHLLEAGLAPQQITGEGLGGWVSLVVSGMVSFEDAVAVLGGEAGVDWLTPRRPEIPFYDPVGRRQLPVCRFDADYLQDLLRFDTDRLWHELGERIGQGLARQEVFQKLVADWDPAAATLGLQVAAGAQRAAFAGGSQALERLHWVVLLDALRRLEEKWDLRSTDSHGQALQELLALLEDGVLQKEQVVKLLCGDLSVAGREAVAAELNERLHLLNLSRPYRMLRSRNERLVEITDFAAWTKALEALRSRAEAGGGAADDAWLDLQVPSAQPARDLLQTLLTHWLQGTPINWQVIYPYGSFTKAGLPLCAFERRSFWVNGPLAGPTQLSGSAPLIHDHVIGGRRLAPGALLLNLVARRLEGAPGHLALERVTLQNPLVFAGDETVDLQVEVTDGEFSLYQGEGRQLLCKGRVQATPGEAGLHAGAMPAKVEPMEPKSADGAYRLLARLGYQYGDGLRVISGVQALEGARYLFELTPRSSSEVARPDLRVDLLDGVFQAALVAGFQSQLLSEAGAPYLPYVISRLRLTGPLNQRSYVLIDTRSMTSKAGYFHASLQVFGANGEPLLEVENLVFGRVNREPERTEPAAVAVPPGSQAAVYRTIWTESPAGGPAGRAPAARMALLLTDETEVARQLAPGLAGAYDRHLLVAAGQRQHREGDRVEIDPANPTHCAWLVEEAAQLVGSGEPAGALDVYDLWATRPPTTPDELATGLQTRLYLLQALLRSRRFKSITMVTATYGCHVVSPHEEGSGHFWGGLVGFARTAMQENPRLSMRLVDFAAGNTRYGEQADLLRRECAAGRGAALVAYRSGKRLSVTLERVTLEAAAGRLPRRTGGAYLITGGLGGIGRQIAAELAREAGNTVVLLGQSKLDAARQHELDRLRAMGAAVDYWQCDLGSRGQVQAVVAAIRERFGPIYGVVHSAGTLADGLIAGKDWESMLKVLKPKVHGAWALHEETHHDPLDFFVVFSSVVSLLGNPGQVDYAAANSCLDAFTHFRRQSGGPGKSLGINWTLWADGGMGRAPEVQEYFGKTIGVIAGTEGVPLFRAILGSPDGQYAVVGNAEGFERMLGETGMAAGRQKPAEPGRSAVEAIEQQLLQTLAAITEVPLSELDVDSDIREYGMESVSLTEFAERLTALFGTEVTPPLLFEHPNIKRLAGYLAKRQPAGRATATATAAPVETAQPRRGLVTPAAPRPADGATEGVLLEILSQLLGIPQSELDGETDLRQFGLESVSLGEFVDRINARLGSDLDSALLFQYTNIRRIAGYLNQRLPAPPPPPMPAPVPAAAATSAAASGAAPAVVRVPAPAPTERRPGPGRDVAIIGVSGRFPASRDVREFWRNLAANRDLITEIPPDRWDWRAIAGDPLGDENQTNIHWGGFLDDIRTFDADFFKLSPREAELMDPQQRLAIEECWRAIEDAGYRPSALAGSRTGVFMGVMHTDYADLMVERGLRMDAYTLTGTSFAIIPNRISYLFDLNGPSVALDTACSSALVAVHQAVLAIRNGDCDLALAGGVNINCAPRKYLSCSNASMLSEDGRCKTFDARANGYVRGEGVGVVLLKSLEAAERDGDHIWAVIRGSAVNHGGFANTLTAPNPIAQADLLVRAWEQADVDPRTVGYIETHGTGTKLGDPIEINGLKNAFATLYERRGITLPVAPHCALGAVKTNIGHLESAAGIAGLIKVLLCMQHQTIPGNLHLRDVNPYIRLDESPFYLATANRPWPAPREADDRVAPRRAGVSSFGFGGVSAHVVLEEYVAPVPVPAYAAQSSDLFVLSAKNAERLRQSAAELSRFLRRLAAGEEGQAPRLSDIAHTLRAGRDEMEERLAVVAAGIPELSDALDRFAAGQSDPVRIFTGRVRTKQTDPAAVAAAARSGNLARLAQLWTAGVAVDWSLLVGPAPRKVSLPGYPFGGDQYWLPEPAPGPGPRKADEKGSPAVAGAQWTEQVMHDSTIMAADLLKREAGQIDVDEPLGQYGFDSIQLKRFAKKLSETYGVELSPNIFFTGGTIRQLAEHLQADHAEALAAYYGARTAVPDRAVAPVPVPVEERRAVGPAAAPSPAPMGKEKELVAIVGVHGLFPGAETLDDFWQNLSDGKELVTEVPADRWDWRQYYGNPAEDRSKSNSKWGAFISDVDAFDARFWGISPREAELMDPQHRKFLEVVWKSIEDAGYRPSQLAGRNIGVFAGVQFQDYQELMQSMGSVPAQMATGNAHAMLTNRVSFLLDLHGPSESIDTACSASLVALHRAVRAIQTGECEWALAGGVSLALSPSSTVACGQMGILSPDGRCKTFDQRANGYVKGEGVIAVLLKPLREAVAHGDHIYAVVRGSAVNHGGKANSLTSPNSQAQSQLLLKAWADAAVDPTTLTYLETHGTGTELGDPVEIEGTKKAFAQSGVAVPDRPYCGIGTVKTNIGHLEPAAGLAGLVKVLMCMKHGQLPAVRHFQQLNPYIDLKHSPLYVVEQNQAWERLRDARGNEIPRRAGISSFGFGGANAHVVVEEYIPPAAVRTAQGEPCVVVLSARDRDRLKVHAAQLVAYLNRCERLGTPVPLAELAYTLQVGREAMDDRLAVVAAGVADLKAALEGFCAGQDLPPDWLCLGNAREGRAKLELLAEDLQSEQFVKGLLAKGKLSRLAQLWVSGLDFDWALLYGSERPRRISLPTYPFEKKRYWFDRYQAKTAPETERAAVPVTTAPVSAAPTGQVATAPMAAVPPVQAATAPVNPAPSSLRPLEADEAYDGDEVVLEIVDREIAIVRMQDRKNRNMTSARLLQGLTARFAEVNRNPSIKAAIVTGYDNLFCMGGTQEVLDNVASQRERCSDFTFIFQGLANCSVPVISAMQGHAIGGGLVFGLFADIVVMALEGVYSCNFTQYGFTPGVGGTFILKEKLGAALANEMMFTAKSYDGRELKERGASVLFRPQHEVMSEALAIARVLARKPRETLRVLKQELAGRLLEQLPPYIDSEVRMHQQTFSAIDVDHLIRHYFRDGEEAQVQEPVPEAKPRLQLKATSGLAAVAKPEVPPARAPQPLRTAPSQSFQESRVDLKRPAGTEAAPAAGNSGPSEAKIQGQLLAALSNILHLEPDQIDLSMPFRELGLDSINGVELVRDLNKLFRINLETVALYDHSTVTSLVRHIRSQLPAEPAGAEAAPPASEDAVVALLRRLRDQELDVSEVEQLLGESV